MLMVYGLCQSIWSVRVYGLIEVWCLVLAACAEYGMLYEYVLDFAS